MPVEGLPDPEKHRACARCLKWFEVDEGRFEDRPSSGLASGVASSIRRAAGDDDQVFICDGCGARRKRRYILYAVVGILAFAAAYLMNPS